MGADADVCLDFHESRGMYLSSFQAPQQIRLILQNYLRKISCSVGADVNIF